MRHIPKILIFSCHGGGGHMAVAAALEQYLPQYRIHTIDLIGKSFAPEDPLFKITKKYTGQDVYNFLLQYNAKRLANILFRMGKFFLPWYRDNLRAIVDTEIKTHEPDLVISIIPMVNDIIIASAENYGIKTIIIPTDFDTTTFLDMIKEINPSTTRVCMSLDIPLVNQKIPANIPAQAIDYTGFPIRPTFFKQRNNIEIKKAYGIPLDKPVIMLVMGAAGSTATLEYIKHLDHIKNQPFHLIACIGRAFFLKETINKMHLSGNFDITIIDHTQDIADLMAIADICITKPGSVTFAEILYTQVPVILDQTSPTLLWERLNITITQQYAIGTSLKKIEHIVALITHWLKNPVTLQTMKAHFSAIPRPLFQEHIYTIIERLIKKEGVNAQQ